MHSNGNELEDLLQDFSKLPGHDRRKITRHLSGRDKLLMKELLSQKGNEAVEPEEVGDDEKITSEEIDVELDLSFYSPWLSERLADILQEDDAETDGLVTEASKDVILKCVENDQHLSVFENLAEENNGHNFRGSLRKWGKRNRG